MNKKQIGALWIGILVFALAGVHPRWTVQYGGEIGYYLSENNPPAWAWFWADPGPLYRVDLRALAIQWILIAALAGAAILSLRTKQKSN